MAKELLYPAEAIAHKEPELSCTGEEDEVEELTERIIPPCPQCAICLQC